MRKIASSLFIMCLTTANCGATVVEYTVRSDWINASGPYVQIGFTGYPDGTLITTQYSALGVVFTDGIDLIDISENLYPNDGAGLRGAFDEIAVAFSQPMYTLAVDHPGSMKFLLYWKGNLDYTSSDFVHGGVGFFSGLISEQPFDAAIILDPSGDVVIDDLYYGPPIPAPSGLALLALTLLSTPRRRRSS